MPPGEVDRWQVEETVYVEDGLTWKLTKVTLGAIEEVDWVAIANGLADALAGQIVRHGDHNNEGAEAIRRYREASGHGVW